MTSPTVDELLTPVTEESLESTQLGVLAAAEFPVTSWASTSVPVGLMKADVRAMTGLAAEIPTTVKGGYVKTAAKEWLTLVGDDFYDEDRVAAVFTQRKIRITDTGGAPYTRNPGDLWIESSAGLKYKNIDAGTVPASGFYDFTFQAESPGDAYNASSSSWTLLTPLPGTSVDDPGGTPVYVVQGADEETDDSYKGRLRGKWAGLGGGANDDVYLGWAKKASAQVTRAIVLRHYPLPGQVTVYIAGSGGTPLDAGVVAAVLAYITPRAPNCVDVFVVAATVLSIGLAGTINVVATERAAAQAAAELALANYAKQAKIGGLVSREKIIEKIMSGTSDDDRNDMTLSFPTGDLVLTSVEVPFFVVGGLTWVEV